MDAVPSSPQEARALGVLWYFTGTPCAQGHIAKRSVSNRECRGCVNAREKIKRALDPTRSRAREKARREQALELFRARSRAQYAKHRAKREAYDRARYPGEAEIRKARASEWIKAHPEYAAARCAIQRARRRRATPWWLTKAQRLEMVAFYAEARRRPGAWEVDHIVPLAGKTVCGLHVPWNLRVVPKAINRSKGNRHEAEGPLISDGESRAQRRRARQRP